MDLINSFLSHRYERGIHYYDAKSVQWVRWDQVFSTNKEMSIPPDASEKIVELMANYDAKNEFVAVRLSGNGLTIEVFRASEVVK